MERRDFFKKTCSYGICGCVGMSLVPFISAYSDTDENKTEETDWRIGFMQERFAKLVDILDNTLADNLRDELLEKLGRACSKAGEEHFIKFKGDINGFVKSISEWNEKVEYNEEAKEIKVMGKKTGKCFCPFVDESKMTTDFCNCSLGWQKGTFEAILGQKVDVTIDSSVLRGGDSCDFTIKVV